MTTETIITALTWVVSVLFPLLVGLVTTKETNPLLKALLLALISAIGGFLAQLIGALTTHVAFSWQDALLTAFGAWVVAVTTHKEIWTRTNLIGALQQIGVKSKAKAVDAAPKHAA